MSRLVVEMRRIRSGQLRPYGDSVYEADLVFSNYWDSTKGEQPGTWCPNEPAVRAMAKILVRHFDDDAGPGGLGPYLKSIHKTGPQTWRVLIVEPYCD
jgi:hypothetical protein